LSFQFAVNPDAKFGPIFDDFKVWWQISPERMNGFIQNRTCTFCTTIPPTLSEKNLVNLVH